MKTVRVRTGTKALLTSRAMLTCVLFVLVCAPFLGYFLVEWRENEGTLRTLFGIAATAPGCGVVAAVFSMLVVWVRRRKAILVLDQHISLPHTGVSFPVEELSTIELWSDRSPRSFMALLPKHIKERVENNGVTAVQPYVVEFPRGADPKPFELADILVQRNPQISVTKLGAL